MCVLGSDGEGRGRWQTSSSCGGQSRRRRGRRRRFPAPQLDSLYVEEEEDEGRTMAFFDLLGDSSIDGGKLGCHGLVFGSRGANEIVRRRWVSRWRGRAEERHGGLLRLSAAARWPQWRVARQPLAPCVRAVCACLCDVRVGRGALASAFLVFPPQ